MKKKPTFIKYPQIPHLAENLGILDADEIQVFEKLDGGNCQVRTSGGRLLPGSRANYLVKEGFFRFPWFRDFNRWAMSNHSLYNLPENLIAFGEFMSLHTLTYKPEFTNRFFLIDVYDTEKERFMPYGKARNVLEKSLGVQDVLFLEPLKKGRLTLENLKELAMGESEYSIYGREGVVTKDYKGQSFAKLWRTSVNPTKKGLIEEINKTIRSIRNSFPLMSPSLESDPETSRLSELVYEEILRSGRLDVSLAEISKATKKILK